MRTPGRGPLSSYPTVYPLKQRSIMYTHFFSNHPIQNSEYAGELAQGNSPASTPAKKASTPPRWKVVRATASRGWPVAIVWSRTASKGLVATLLTAPTTSPKPSQIPRNRISLNRSMHTCEKDFRPTVPQMELQFLWSCNFCTVHRRVESTHRSC
jgi:hypothetical protein